MYCSGGLMLADSLAFSTSSAVIGAVKKLESSVIPLLAVMQGGESPYSNFFTAPMTAATVRKLQYSSEFRIPPSARRETLLGGYPPCQRFSCVFYLPSAFRAISSSA